MSYFVFIGRYNPSLPPKFAKIDIAIDRCFHEDRYRDRDVFAKIDIAISKIHRDRDESPNPPQKANWGNSDQSLFNPDLSKGGDTKV